MTETIRVLVVDDSAFMRTALCRRIEADPRFVIIDTACDGNEAVEKALRLKPDVMTLDVEMPGLNGIEALKIIVANSTIPVIMVSSVTQAGAKTTLEALAIGAVDFVPKTNGVNHIHEKLAAAASARSRQKPRNGLDPFKIPMISMPLAKPFMRARRGSVKAVIIGSSTGGPQALRIVIAQLPAKPAVPIIIAQHMPQPFTAALAADLDETCPPRVVEAKEGGEVAPGVVYIAPGGLHLRIQGGVFRVKADQGESLYRPSIDVLAASALETFRGDVLAVMLTGIGNDGTREFLNLREAGAITIAQDQGTCVVFGMPKSLIDAGGADEILPLIKIGPRIRDHIERSS